MGGGLLLLLLLLAANLDLARAPRPTTQPSFTIHPRLFFSSADLPHLRAKGKTPFMAGVLQQYEDALNHKLNYSAGGVLQDVGADPAKKISDNEGRGTRHELAASLFVAGYGDVSRWGQLGKQVTFYWSQPNLFAVFYLRA